MDTQGQEMPEEGMRRAKIEEGAKELLGRLHPTLWWTITFRRPISLPKARKKVTHFLKFLNKRNQIFYQKYLTFWTYFEECAKGAGHHVHILIAGIDQSQAPILETRCCKKFGQSKVKPYDYGRVKSSAVGYMATKYARNPDNLKLLTVNSRFRKFRQAQEGGLSLDPNPKTTGEPA